MAGIALVRYTRPRTLNVLVKSFARAKSKGIVTAVDITSGRKEYDSSDSLSPGLSA